MQIECRNYAHDHGIDLPEVADWQWPYGFVLEESLSVFWCGGLLHHFEQRRGRRDPEEWTENCPKLGITYHGVRFRTTGYRQVIEVHLLFPHFTTMGEAHRLATILV